MTSTIKLFLRRLNPLHWINLMKREVIHDRIEEFLKEYVETQERLNEWSANRETSTFDLSSLSMFSVLGNQSITKRGHEFLVEAADLLRQRQDFAGRFTRNSVYEQLQRSISEEISQISPRRNFSEYKVVQHAEAALEQNDATSSRYVFPAVISSKQVTIDLELGPARVLSKQQFRDELGPLLEKEQYLKPSEEAMFAQLMEDWEKYADEYHYFIVVQIDRCEPEMAWRAARSVSEYVLNTIRLWLPHRDASEIRLAGARRPERSQSALRIDIDDTIHPSRNLKFEGASIEASWIAQLNDTLEPLMEMLSSIASVFASPKSSSHPVVDRLRYANQLISEAYSDDSVRIRVVKLVSALEALAVLPKDEKADTLAKRCSIAISSTAPGSENAVRDTVLRLYKERNQVVHGDSISDLTAWAVLDDLDQYLGLIVICSMGVLVRVHNQHRPQSNKPLRKYVAAEYERLSQL